MCIRDRRAPRRSRPDPLVPLPTAIRIDPPLPPVATPALTMTAPKLPDDVVPELNASAPLTPAAPALALQMPSMTDVLRGLSPDPTLADPPEFQGPTFL